MKFKSKEEVREYLKNSKIDVGDRSEEVQKILYRYGFRWIYWENISDVPLWLSARRFLRTEGMYINSHISEHNFNEDNYKELSVDDILSIEIEPEKVFY